MKRTIKVDGLRERLRDLILGSGLPAREVAKELGISTVAVNHWMSGRQEPHVGLIPVICKRFGVSADWLLGLSDKRKRT